MFDMVGRMQRPVIDGRIDSGWVAAGLLVMDYSREYRARAQEIEHG